MKATRSRQKNTGEKRKLFFELDLITSSESSIILKHGLMSSLRCYRSYLSPNGVEPHEKCRVQCHLVSNLTILHNVRNMSEALQSLARDGFEITPDILADLSPYRRKHINRFGDYRLDTSRPVPKIDYDLVIPVAGDEKKIL